MTQTIEVCICSVKEAEHMHTVFADHTISILDPNGPWNTLNLGRNHTVIFADDIWETGHKGKLFDESDANRVRHVIETLKSNRNHHIRLLVHCHAGISRSPSVAVGALCLFGKTPSNAIKHVLKVRPEAYFNLHIIKVFDDLIGLNGELTLKAKAARDSNPFIIMVPREPERKNDNGEISTL